MVNETKDVAAHETGRSLQFEMNIVDTCRAVELGTCLLFDCSRERMDTVDSCRTCAPMQTAQVGSHNRLLHIGLLHGWETMLAQHMQIEVGDTARLQAAEKRYERSCAAGGAISTGTRIGDHEHMAWGCRCLPTRLLVLVQHSTGVCVHSCTQGSKLAAAKLCTPYTCAFTQRSVQHAARSWSSAP